MGQDIWDVVVVGAGYAGLTAANRLGVDTRVLVVDPKDHFIHRVRLHEVAAGGKPRVRLTLRRALRRHVGLRKGSVIHIEPGLLRLADGDEIRARHIVMSTGSDGSVSGGIATIDDALVARERLSGLAAGTHVVVRGAGLTGIELSAEIATRRRDLVVHLHDRGDIGAWLPERARASLLESLVRHSVRVAEPVPDDAFEITTTGMRIPDLASSSALVTDPRGRLAVAATLEAEPGIWGAGDAVTIADQPHVRGSCAAAIPMGAHVADNIARALNGQPVAPFDFGFSWQCISLGRHDGLIVQVDPFDQPTGRHLHGRTAAAFKAAICAGALLVPSNFARLYRWRGNT